MRSFRRTAGRIALEEVGKHPIRSLLISQGMLWAVVLAVVPVAVIDGSRREAVERSRELGTDLVQITSERVSRSDSILQESDLLPLREGVEAEIILSSLRVERAHLRGQNQVAWLLGCDGDLPAARGRRVFEGHFPNSADLREVALEARLASILSPDRSPVGLGLRMQGKSGSQEVELIPDPGMEDWTVVGVVEDETESSIDRFGYEKGRLFHENMKRLLQLLGVAPARVPWLESGLGIYLHRSRVEGESLDWIFISTDPRRVSEVADQARNILVSEGRSPLIYTNAVWSILTRPELEGYLRLHRVFFALSVGLGMVVLANLLLLTGWQRRREIALRRAEGARRIDIFSQFLWEGVLIAFIGLVVGFPLGMLIAKMRVSLDPSVVMTIAWPWKEGVKAGLILTASALIASCYPAWKASGHDPMTLFRRSP